MKQTILSLNEESTQRLGRCFGRFAFPGSFFALYGDLGAGKTVFARGLGGGLSISEPITSPTFTIVLQYMGRLPFFHFDAYRLNSEEELYAIGYDDYLSANGVVLMEWPGNVPQALPNARLEISIAYDADTRRSITLQAEGEQHVRLLELALICWKGESAC